MWRRWEEGKDVRRKDEGFVGGDGVDDGLNGWRSRGETGRDGSGLTRDRKRESDICGETRKPSAQCFAIIAPRRNLLSRTSSTSSSSSFFSSAHPHSFPHSHATGSPPLSFSLSLGPTRFPLLAALGTGTTPFFSSLDPPSERLASAPNPVAFARLPSPPNPVPVAFASPPSLSPYELRESALPDAIAGPAAAIAAAATTAGGIGGVNKSPRVGPTSAAPPLTGALPTTGGSDTIPYSPVENPAKSLLPPTPSPKAIPRIWCGRATSRGGYHAPSIQLNRRSFRRQAMARVECISGAEGGGGAA